LPAPSSPAPSVPAAGASDPAAQDWLAGASPRVQAMCADLRARLFAFDPGVSARISPRYNQRCCSFLLDCRSFVHAVPLGARLRLLLILRRGDLEDPDGIARCTAGRTSHGRSEWQIDVFDGRDLERAMPLIRQAFEVAKALVAGLPKRMA